MPRNPTIIESFAIALMSGLGLLGVMLLVAPIDRLNLGIAAAFTCATFFTSALAKKKEKTTP